MKKKSVSRLWLMSVASSTGCSTTLFCWTAQRRNRRQRRERRRRKMQVKDPHPAGVFRKREERRSLRLVEEKQL